ncbi:MAG: large conductance mechanosensitive channel protein MscL [Jatrophihabitantaceae bacterium]
MLKGFKEFIMRGNVVDLAVAVVLAMAFGAVVTALVRDLITPVIAAIVGKPDFSALTFTINKSKFFYGGFINAVLQFVLIVAAIYFFVIIPIKKLTEARARRRAAGDPEESASIPSDEALLLREIRDLLSAQQKA